MKAFATLTLLTLAVGGSAVQATGCGQTVQAYAQPVVAVQQVYAAPVVAAVVNPYVPQVAVQAVYAQPIVAAYGYSAAVVQKQFVVQRQIVQKQIVAPVRQKVVVRRGLFGGRTVIVR